MSAGSWVKGIGWGLIFGAIGWAYDVPFGIRLVAVVAVCIVGAAGDVTDTVLRYRKAARDVRNGVSS